MLYTTRQLKIGKNEQLDFLAHEAGIVYSQVLVTFWRIVRRNNHWLSEYGMKRLIRNRNLQSQTVQGIIETFYESLKSWYKLRKLDPSAKPPKRRRWYHAIPFKVSAITLRDGVLRLSTGKGNTPIIIPWKWGLPKLCEISFNGKEYVLNATYVMEPVNSISGTGYAGIDLGEIHPEVVDTGKRIIIANGRELRSKRRYQNKIKAYFQRKIDKCKKYSRKWKSINKAKKRVLRKLDNQIKDILHKQTTAVVCVMKEDEVQTVGIGDVRDIRKNVDYSRHAN